VLSWVQAANFSSFFLFSVSVKKYREGMLGERKLEKQFDLFTFKMLKEGWEKWNELLRTLKFKDGKASLILTQLFELSSC
jgi:hypothetical protein